MHFGGKLPILTIFCQFLVTHPRLRKICRKKGPLFREFWIQKPTHMGGKYPYPQHVMLPPSPSGNQLVFESVEKYSVIIFKCSRDVFVIVLQLEVHVKIVHVRIGRLGVNRKPISNIFMSFQGAFLGKNWKSENCIVCI